MAKNSDVVVITMSNQDLGIHIRKVFLVVRRVKERNRLSVRCHIFLTGRSEEDPIESKIVCIVWSPMTG